MLDTLFMEKLSELIDAYNEHLKCSSGTDVPHIDKELEEIMNKIEQYIRRFH